MTRSSLSADVRGAILPSLVYGGLRCVHLRLTGRYSIADDPVFKKKKKKRKKNDPNLCLQLAFF